MTLLPHISRAPRKDHSNSWQAEQLPRKWRLLQSKETFVNGCTSLILTGAKHTQPIHWVDIRIFMHICHSSHGMNRSLFIHNVHRDPAAREFYKMITWASKSPHHHLIFTQQLSHLYNGMWHLHFPNLVLVLMHLHSDSHSKVSVMSMELIGLRVFANCITIKPSLRQRMRPSS